MGELVLLGPIPSLVDFSTAGGLPAMPTIARGFRGQQSPSTAEFPLQWWEHALGSAEHWRGFANSLSGGDYTSPPKPQAFAPPTSGVAANGLPIFSWDQAAAQITRTGASWSANLATPATITYAFRSTAPAVMPEDTAGFSRFSQTQILVAEASLRLWSDVANISFQRVGAGTSGDAAYSNFATMLFANYSSGVAGASAFAFLPTFGQTGAGSVEGDVWVNITIPENANLVFGEFGPHVLAHEIGHAIGLSHPGNYDGGAPTYQLNALYWQDARMFTIMSYFGSSNVDGSLNAFSAGPQLHDIAAAQRLYGANLSVRTGDTIYGFNSNTGQQHFTITADGQSPVFAIWDAGGVDTLDLSGFSTASEIDLREEAFSGAGPGNSGIGLAHGNIAIARGAVIENAIGGSGNDTLIGNAVNNNLNGGGGDDTLDGGAGADIASYLNAAGAVTVSLAIAGAQNTGAAGIDTLISIEALEGGNFADTLTGDAGGNRLDGLGGDDMLDGGAGNDVLVGGGGADTLDGGLGIDTYNGGEGDDTYVSDSPNELFFSTVDPGSHLVRTSAASFGLGSSDRLGIENLTFIGAGNFFGVGNDLDNILTGGSGNDVLAGSQGADTLVGGFGDDIYNNVESNDTIVENADQGRDAIRSETLLTFDLALTTNVEDLQLGADGVLSAFGNALANTIALVFSTSSVEARGRGGDDVLIGGTSADLFFGDEGDDQLRGFAGGDILNGGAGVDVLDGGDGIDTADYSSSAAGVNVSLAAGTGIGGDAQGDTLTNIENLIGGAGEDTLSGDGAANRLDGGGGVDAMFGGDGDDVYVVDVAGDLTTEDSALGGVDTVQSTVTRALGGNLENLTLLGAGAISATGNELNNVLLGNDGANTLSGQAGDDLLLGGAGADFLGGGAGNDRLAGGDGDDTYTIDSVGDLTDELAGGGTDLVLAAVDFSLSSNFENLSLLTGALNGAGNAVANIITGNNAANILNGQGGDDRLNGAAGNDTLNGGAGADILNGGAGDDLYIVDSLGDVLVEAPGGGIDSVQSSLTRSLSSDFENLILQAGAGAINGTGNALGNVITGNGGANILNGQGGDDTLLGEIGNDTLLGGTGNDILNGGGGADVMNGGAGDDLYHVDSSGDVLSESPGAGIDSVLSTITRSLNSDFENLTLLGALAINATGNVLANVITGNSAANILIGNGGDDVLLGEGGNDALHGGIGNDTLNGGEGADVMSGGDGDDLYIVDAAGDVLSEAAIGGIDTVHTTVSRALNSGFENLTLLDGAVSATGNVLNNILTGNAAANSLLGNGGDDTLIGGAGADAMDGGAGADSFVFTAGFGADSITGFDADPAGGQDLLNLAALGINAGNFSARVILTDLGADTLITIDGLDTITLFAVNPAALDPTDLILGP